MTTITMGNCVMLIMNLDSKALRDHIWMAEKNMFVIVYLFGPFSILWVNKLLSTWILTNIQIT